MDDTVFASYKGKRIVYRLVKIREGEWKANFSLTEHDVGKVTEPEDYAGTVMFSSREAAMDAARVDAHSIIDGKL